MSKGVSLSLLSSALFALLYFHASQLAPLSGEQIFAWRMLLTLPWLTVLLRYSGDWAQVEAIFARLRRQPVFALALLASAVLVGLQLWLFMWAPIHGRGLQVSLGYFLLPLCMIAAGRLLYGDRLSPMQWLAAGLAALGVAHQCWQFGSFAWETLLAALGYPPYFMLRRKLGTDHVGGLWCDMALLLPPALYLLLAAGTPLAPFAGRPALWLLVPLLGVISALALASYLQASRQLSFSLFGLLGYVEPVLLVLVALALGERIAPAELPAYLAIWAAMAVLALEGIWHLLGRPLPRLARVG